MQPSFVTRLRNNLARLISPSQSFGISQIRPSVARWSLSDHQGDVREMIRAFKSIVYACIHVRATAIANAATEGKFKVQRKSGQDEFTDVPLTHPLVQLLNNPCPYFTKFDYWYYKSAYQDLTGNAYDLIARNGLGKPAELWPLPSQNVKIIPGDTSKGQGIIQSYEVNWGSGNIFVYPENDICQIKHPNPADPYFYGKSKVIAAAEEIDILDYVSAHQKEFFKNGAIPAGVFTFPNELRPEQRQAFEDDVLSKFGHGQSGKNAYLDNGATFVSLAGQKELDYLNSIGIYADRILAVMGVPKSKLMQEENITARATMEVLDYNFLKETIEPALTAIDQQLTLDLASEFDENLVIRHDSVIPRDMQREIDLASRRIQANITTINEERAGMDLEPLEGGDEPLVSFGLTPLSQVGMDAQPIEEPVKSIKKHYSETEKASIYKNKEKLRIKWERKITGQLKTGFREIKRGILEVISKSDYQPVGDKYFIQKQVEQFFKFDTAEWEKIINQIVLNGSMSAFEDAFKKFMRDNSVNDIVFSPNSPQVLAGLEKIKLNTVTVPETLLDELEREIERGIQLQESLQELSKRVSRFLDGSADYRSMRIARTTSNYAINKGNTLAATDSGIFARKGWLTMRDLRVRDGHIFMDGVEVPIGASFIVDGESLEEPGDPSGSAENIINCRCTVYYLQGEAELTQTEAKPINYKIERDQSGKMIGVTVG